MTERYLRSIAAQEAYADTIELVQRNSHEFDELYEDLCHARYDKLVEDFYCKDAYYSELDDTWYVQHDTHIESVEFHIE